MSPRPNYPFLPSITPLVVEALTSRKALVWLVLGAVQLCYCIWHVVAKEALLNGLSALVLALYREIMASVLMHTMAYFVDGKPVFHYLTREDIKPLLLLGLFSYGNIVGFIVALQYISTFNASLLHPTIPVMAALMSSATGVEHLSRYGWVGVLICTVGAVVVILWGVKEDDSSGADSATKGKLFYGNFILILQCLSMAALLVAQKPMLRRIPPTSLTAAYYTVAVFLTLITTLSTVDPSDTTAYTLHNTISWVSLIYGLPQLSTPPALSAPISPS
jgi:drug/metabolite transporter (DMT)-like permease